MSAQGEDAGAAIFPLRLARERLERMLRRPTTAHATYELS